MDKKASKPKKLKPKTSFGKRRGDDTAEIIAKSSAAIAATAGAIAAGVMLADRGRRQRLGKGVKHAISEIQRLASKLPEEYPDAYEMVQHQIGTPKGAIKTLSKKSSKLKTRSKHR